MAGAPDLEDVAATSACIDANTLEDRAAFTQHPVPVSYEGESAAERVARRRRAWTPASVG